MIGWGDARKSLVLRPLPRALRQVSPAAHLTLLVDFWVSAWPAVRARAQHRLRQCCPGAGKDRTLGAPFLAEPPELT